MLGWGSGAGASTGPTHLPPPPPVPTFPLRAWLEPQLQRAQNCIILGFVHRAAGGGVARSPCPPFPLISFLGNPSPSSLLRLTAPPL